MSHQKYSDDSNMLFPNLSLSHNKNSASGYNNELSKSNFHCQRHLTQLTYAKYPFFVLYPEDNFVKQYLNVVLILCSRNVSGLAHITVRGPYRHRPNLKRNWMKRESITVKVTEVGNFFENDQATAFFRCEIKDVNSIWWKPYYPLYKNGHITIYDEKSKEFSLEITETIKESFKPFKFKSRKIFEYNYKKSQFSMLPILESNPFLFKNSINLEISYDFLRNISQKDSIKYIKYISNMFYSSPNFIHNYAI